MTEIELNFIEILNNMHTLFAHVRVETNSDEKNHSLRKLYSINQELLNKLNKEIDNV